MHKMTEAEWMTAKRRDPSKIYVEVDVPSVWRYRAFVLIVALALVSAGGVLTSVYKLAFVTLAHAEFGSNQDRGYGPSPDRDHSSGGDWEPMRGRGRHHGYAPRSHWDALRDIFRSMVGIEDRPRASVRRLSPSEQRDRDRSVDRSDRSGNRGGPYD